MARRYQRNGALLQRFFARVTIETLNETGNRARQTSGTQGKIWQEVKILPKIQHFGRNSRFGKKFKLLQEI